MFLSGTNLVAPTRMCVLIISAAELWVMEATSSVAPILISPLCPPRDPLANCIHGNNENKHRGQHETKNRRIWAALTKTVGHYNGRNRTMMDKRNLIN